MPTIDVSGARLAWREEGRGTPVVTLHSTGSNGGQWKRLMSDLGGRHRVFAVDLPGYGGSSPWPGGGLASVEAEARMVAALLECMDGRVHLVGHSYGATVALKIAMLRPDRVASLAIFEPAVFHLLRQGGVDDQPLHREIAAVEGLLCASAAVGAPEAGMKRFVDFWNGEGVWDRTAPEAKQKLLSVFPQVVANFAAIDREAWMLTQLRRMLCPTLALMASGSPALARRIVRMIATMAPDCTMRIVSGVGHMAPITHPELVNPAIAAHIAEVERRTVRLRAA